MNNEYTQRYNKAMNDYEDARQERSDGGSGQDAASDFESVIHALDSLVQDLMGDLEEPNVVVAQHVNTINM